MKADTVQYNPFRCLFGDRDRAWDFVPIAGR